MSLLRRPQGGQLPPTRAGFLFARLLPELLLASVVAIAAVFLLRFVPATISESSTTEANTAKKSLAKPESARPQMIFNLTMVGERDLIYSTLDQLAQRRPLDRPQFGGQIRLGDVPVLEIAGTPGSRRLLINDIQLALWFQDDYLSDELPERLESTGPLATNSAPVLSNCGRWAASALADQTVNLWDLDQGGCPVVLSGMTSPVLDIEFTPDGSTVVVVDNDGMRLFDRETGVLRRDLEFGRTRMDHIDLVISSDGRLAATAGFCGEIQLWNLETGRRSWELTDPGMIALSAVFSQEEKSLIIGTNAGNLVEIDLETAFIFRETSGHSAGIRSLVPVPGSDRFLTQGYDGKVKSWKYDFTTPPELVF